MGGWQTALLVLAIWTPVATLVGWGSYLFAKRDPRSTSWMKIIFASMALGVFGVTAACLFFSPVELLLRGGTLPAVLFSGVIFIFWTMVIIGAPVCVGCITGVWLGMRR